MHCIMLTQQPTEPAKTVDYNPKTPPFKMEDGFGFCRHTHNFD